MTVRESDFSIAGNSRIRGYFLHSWRGCDDRCQIVSYEILRVGLLNHYFVKLGVHGQIGHASSDLHGLKRETLVVCRTQRGIERGIILASDAESGADAESGVDAEERKELGGDFDANILRVFEPGDLLLSEHLNQLASESLDQCQHWLTQNGKSEVLLDVEPLLDGRTLFFHFLGDVSLEANEYVTELVNLYEQRVANSEFAKLLENGCGPGCGTEEKSGCGTGGGCAVCVMQSACAK